MAALDGESPAAPRRPDSGLDGDAASPAASAEPADAMLEHWLGEDGAKVAQLSDCHSFDCCSYSSAIAEHCSDFDRRRNG